MENKKLNVKKQSNKVIPILTETIKIYEEFKRNGDYVNPNLKDILHKFIEKLGYNLIVEPDDTLKMGTADGSNITVFEEWGNEHLLLRLLP